MRRAASSNDAADERGAPPDRLQPAPANRVEEAAGEQEQRHGAAAAKAADEREHLSAIGADRLAQPRRHDDVEPRQRRTVDQPLGDRREDGDDREAHREADEQVEREIPTLRVAPPTRAATRRDDGS